MPIDYRTYDLRNMFYLQEVAIAWCDFDEVTPVNKRCYTSMFCALTEAIGKGELKCGDPIMLLTGSGSTLYNFTFSRENLKQWALSKGQKPKFLFPEMRDEKHVRQKEAAAIKLQEIDKACVQAVVRALRDINPEITSAALVKHPAVKIYANGGQWQPPTIKSWIREIDERPKDKRAGRPRKTVAENIQPQYEDIEK